MVFSMMTVFVSILRRVGYSVGFQGLHGGLLCASWGNACHLGSGLPPLRSRAGPLGLPHLSARNQLKLLQGTEFFLRHLDISNGDGLNSNTRTTDNPIDPRGRFPRIWATQQWRHRQAVGDWQVDRVQCMFGAEIK